MSGLAALQRHFLARLREQPDAAGATARSTTIACGCMETSNDPNYRGVMPAKAGAKRLEPLNPKALDSCVRRNDEERRVCRGGHLPRDVGLNIYLHAYGARLREALDHDHPVLGTYLGDSLWDAMCRGYIAAHPSRHRSLRDFGADLPGYLAQADPFRTHPELAEIAAFERRLLASFDAADAERASWDTLLTLPSSDWPALQLRFHPSLRLHYVMRNSVEIWRAIKDGGVPPAVGAASSNDWVLWRDADRVSRFRSLDAAESAAVGHCLGGGSFAGLCAVLADWHAVDTVPMMALEHLRTWCADGWIRRWEVSRVAPPGVAPYD